MIYKKCSIFCINYLLMMCFMNYLQHIFIGIACNMFA